MNVSRTSAVTSVSEIASTYKADLIESYSLASALTVVCYEALITFRYEYEFIWQRKWTFATWIFLMNRYLILANMITDLMPFSAEVDVKHLVGILWPPSHHHHRCSNFSLMLFVRLLSTVPSLIVAAVSALRVFALLGRAFGPAAFTFALGLVSFSLNIYLDSKRVYYHVDDPVLGSSCFFDYLVSPSAAFNIRSLTLASMFCTIAVGVVAVVVTWCKTYRHPPLVSANPINDFVHILPNILLSRFLIDLRRVGAPNASSITYLSRFSVANFRVPSIPSIIGNLGEPLADSEEDLDGIEDGRAQLYEDGAGMVLGAEDDDGTVTSSVLSSIYNSTEEVFRDLV
ncbi:hypothetical protein NM688_g9089 [Phlebia brevispora]|uniref:Uncharacterized protein n=1 Tax=Phlebia brevispora TaxID=194682 RepID=A0ACC1RKX1_9APHY|nr:hypothetical protein NM688_g9089 [Phlebia brevispora]